LASGRAILSKNRVFRFRRAAPISRREHPAPRMGHPGRRREHPAGSMEDPARWREDPGERKEHPAASRGHPARKREADRTSARMPDQLRDTTWFTERMREKGEPERSQHRALRRQNPALPWRGLPSWDGRDLDSAKWGVKRGNEGRIHWHPTRGRARCPQRAGVRRETIRRLLSASSTAR
jgi:hypothetical protein